MGRVQLSGASVTNFLTGGNALPGGDAGGLGPTNAQAMRLAVSFASDPGASAINFLAILRNDERVMCVRPFTATKVTNARSAGSTGNYVCQVDVASSGKDVLDLMGSGFDKARWFVALTDAGPGGAVYVDSWVANQI